MVEDVNKGGSRCHYKAMLVTCHTIVLSLVCVNVPALVKKGAK